MWSYSYGSSVKPTMLPVMWPAALRYRPNKEQYDLPWHWLLALEFVTLWRHQLETRYWPFVRGIHRSPVNSPHKGNEAQLWCFLWSSPEQSSKQSRHWWFETPSRLLWRHCAEANYYDVSQGHDSAITWLPNVSGTISWHKDKNNLENHTPNFQFHFQFASPCLRFTTYNYPVRCHKIVIHGSLQCPTHAGLLVHALRITKSAPTINICLAWRRVPATHAGSSEENGLVVRVNNGPRERGTYHWKPRVVIMPILSSLVAA